MFVYIAWSFKVGETLIEGLDKNRRTIEDAKKAVEYLDDIWGEKTHYIVPINEEIPYEQ